MVRLRNGKEEFATLVATVTLIVKQLFESTSLPDMLVLYDLASAAHDRTYDLSFNRKRLIDMGMLAANGVMHDSIRNILASMLTIEGDTVKMTSPAAP